MNKFREDANYLGNIMIYQNGKHEIYQSKELLEYLEEKDKFITWENNAYLLDEIENDNIDYSKLYIPYEKKDIEGYIYVDTNSLIEELHDKKAIEKWNTILKNTGHYEEAKRSRR